ncbi:MAG: photosynthetic reaction center subunit H [Pseudomonadota bacterium]
MAIGSIDLVEILFTLFWVFFIGLILYLHRESKREGYPLQSDRSERDPSIQIKGFPAPPPPKSYALAHGGVVTVPRVDPETPLAAEPAAGFPGAPLVPTGNPMRDGVGPASYANRSNTPDKTLHGENRIVPMRVATDFAVTGRDPDPRGMSVIAGDGETAGTVADLWVDRSEPMIVYYEVDLGAANGNKRVLLPSGFVKVAAGKRQLNVRSIHASQFAAVPALASPDQITLLEEDKICGYYGGGTLYADEARQEPVL